MNRRVWIGLGLAAACLVAIGWQSGSGGPAPFGFVEIERVINEYEKNAALSRELQAEFEAKRAELEKEKEKIDLRKEELQLLARDSQKHRDLRLAIQVEEFRLEQSLKELSRSLDSRKIDGWKELFSDITRAAERVAKARGLSAVLVVNRGPLIGINDQEIMSQISLRQVLYADASLDITDDLLAILNP